MPVLRISARDRGEEGHLCAICKAEGGELRTPPSRNEVVPWMWTYSLTKTDNGWWPARADPGPRLDRRCNKSALGGNPDGSRPRPAEVIRGVQQEQQRPAESERETPVEWPDSEKKQEESAEEEDTLAFDEEIWWEVSGLLALAACLLRGSGHTPGTKCRFPRPQRPGINDMHRAFGLWDAGEMQGIPTGTAADELLEGCTCTVGYAEEDRVILHAHPHEEGWERVVRGKVRNCGVFAQKPNQRDPKDRMEGKLMVSWEGEHRTVRCQWPRTCDTKQTTKKGANLARDAMLGRARVNYAAGRKGEREMYVDTTHHHTAGGGAPECRRGDTEGPVSLAELSAEVAGVEGAEASRRGRGRWWDWTGVACLWGCGPANIRKDGPVHFVVQWPPQREGMRGDDTRKEGAAACHRTISSGIRAALFMALWAYALSACCLAQAHMQRYVPSWMPLWGRGRRTGSSNRYCAGGRPG